jgi:hypothetical protein
VNEKNCSAENEWFMSSCINDISISYGQFSSIWCVWCH